VVGELISIVCKWSWWIYIYWSPRKLCRKKNWKLRKIYGKIWLKIGKICTEVACTLPGCVLQIWLGFVLVKIYSNTQVV